MIPIASPIIGEEEKRAVEAVLESGILAQGPQVKAFEEEFASYVGTEEAIATSSGTTALHIALLSAGVKEGDEVITTPFTFIASANSILYCGAKPVFVDIGEDYNIDESQVSSAITEKTKALLVVHLYGNPCQMDVLMDIAEDHELIVIEDACQAHGAEFKNKRVGSFGIGCFSFYPTKNMTCGEGGMITTNDKDVAEKARLLRNHGSKVRYYHDILGFNFRMTDISAAIGREQLKKLEKFNQLRIKNAERLNHGLSKISGIITPVVRPERVHVYHQYTIRITPDFPLSRDEVMEVLKEKEIGYAVFYPLPIYKQKLYLDLGYDLKLPKCEELSSQVLSLPVHPSLTSEDIDTIISAFEEMHKG